MCDRHSTGLFPRNVGCLGNRRGWKGALQVPDPMPTPGFVLPSRSQGLGEVLELFLESASKVKGEGGKQLHEWRNPGGLRFLQQAQPQLQAVSKGTFLKPLSVSISRGTGFGIVAQGTDSIIHLSIPKK